MDVIRTAVSMLGLYDTEVAEGDNRDKADYRRAISITSKIGVIAAYYHRSRQGLDLPPVRKDLSEAAHFLYLLNGETPSEDAAKTLDVAYVLHADHGMNASTFSARVTIATLSDIYSAITSAIGTLKDRSTAGQRGVIQMLLEIGSEDKVDAWVEEQLAQKKKIMGIGHRVYKVLDPRAPHLRAMAIKLCEQLGEGKWIRMSERIATIMKERKGLNANVDFYSATCTTTRSASRPTCSPRSLPSRAPAAGLLTSSSSSRTTASTVRSASTSARRWVSSSSPSSSDRRSPEFTDLTRRHAAITGAAFSLALRGASDVGQRVIPDFLRAPGGCLTPS